MQHACFDRIFRYVILATSKIQKNRDRTRMAYYVSVAISIYMTAP